LGRGDNAVAFRVGESGPVEKEFAFGTPLHNREAADIMSRAVNGLSDFLGGGIVPRMNVDRPGVVRQAFAEGLRFRDLAPEAATRAQGEMDALVGRAQGYSLPTERGRMGNLWRCNIDRNRENFRFHPSGEVRSWYDPIGLRP